MEASIDAIGISDICLCDEINPDVLNAIQAVYREDGQAEPIIVTSGRTGYEVVVGRHRLEAAKNLGWETIEATVTIIDDSNMRRAQRRIQDNEINDFCRGLSEEFDLSNETIGELVGLSDKTVRDKVALQTDLVNSLRKKYENGEISARKGLVILQLPKEEQTAFAEKMVKEDWSRDELRENIDDFQNDTLVTIGAEGRTPRDIISKMIDKNVGLLLDIRTDEDHTSELESVAEQMTMIEYEHRPEFSPHVGLVSSYESREIGDDEFGDRYRTFISENIDLFQEFAESLENKVGVLGPKRYPVPNETQDRFCHRYHFAGELVEMGYFDRMYDVTDSLAIHPVLPKI